MNNPVKLNPELPEPLTDRACAQIIGPVIGGLIAMSDTATVRRALEWYLNNETIWEMLRDQEVMGLAIATELLRKKGVQ